MADLFDVLFRPQPGRPPARGRAPESDIVAVSQLPTVRFRTDDGEKFPGGYGATDLFYPDYWTLRARSAELFERNLYARGLIRRLVTNEINTGLHLEAKPEEGILGLERDALADWTEEVENRFALWGKSPDLCDHFERSSFGALQQMVRTEALVVGDVLVVRRQDPRTRLPRVQLINGASVRTPLFGSTRPGNKIDHGVEIDARGRHVAFWVQQADGTTKRLPAFGEKSGKKLAWLVYGTDKRLDDVRGKPLLSLVLQSLKEIDRYRDSTQRKAVINSMLALFVTKNQDKGGTRPIGVGAIRRTTELATDTRGEDRRFNVAEYIPGLVLDELQVGEEPKGFPATGTDEKFGEFEEAIIQAIAWANEVPPEILRLAFTNNYSASQAAINEFKSYLNKMRTGFGEAFCEPLYQEWLVSEVLAGRVDAPGLLEAWRDPMQFATLGAWVASDWSGAIKPAVDMSKLVRAYRDAVREGFMTRDRATRELTGTKFSKNVQRLTIENGQVRDANQPLADLAAAGLKPEGDGGGAGTQDRPGRPRKPAPPQQQDDAEDDDQEDDERAAS